ncbi:insecticidal toxin complex protein [Chaetomium sp. MPI-CAGE-AT-0009]|nr:insecticidal toxin complex protein [Chaetomium sp. MPI-CAGE-AT-0009]
MAATYFLVRIIPSKLIAADVFQDALSNITITAFDKTVRTAGTDREIGSAKNLAPGPNPNDSPPTVPPLELLSNPPRFATSILQHLRQSSPGNFQGLSVATAVIVVNQEHLTGSTPEYPTATSFDIRLQISRTSGAGNPRPVVRDQVVDFNIKTTNKALSAVQNDYTRASTDIYLTIDVPDEPLPSGTTVLLPDRDGKPPSFDVLRDAINDVLQKDHPDGAGSIEDMTRFLTTAECQQIASELVNNRILDPPPAAPYPTSNTGGSNPSIIFEDLFTAGAVADAEDRKLRDLDRQKFDGARTSYYALHSADALQLANHVFTLVTAVQAEQYTAQRGRMATIDVPLKEGISHSSARASMQLSLTGSLVPPATDVQALNPPFIVPAPFLYALTTSYAISQAFETRIKVLLTSSSDTLADLMRQAIDAGVLHPMDPSGFVFEHSTLSATPATNITQHQAIRRLVALRPFVGTTTTDRFVELGGNIDLADLVAMWLDFMDGDDALLEGFWRPLFASRQYLVAILESIAPNQEDLIAGIFQFLRKPGGGPVSTVDDLIQISEQMWLSFFGAHEELLPPRYVLGDLAARVHSFVVDITKVLSVPPGTVPPETHAPGGVPYLDGASDRDVLVQFFKSFTAFSLSSPFDDAMRQQVYEAALGLFGSNVEIASFIATAVEELWTLYRVTELGFTPELRFSLMEALHARGFTTVSRILEFPEASFTTALVGTVAYQTAPDIYQLAEDLPWDPDDDDTSPGRGFQPVNPGSLIECVPPPHLSPFGPMQYLHELLELSDGSSTIRDALETRRGDLGSLLVTSANQGLALTAVDIVNENLEAFALGLDQEASDGLVHNTLDNCLTELDIPNTDPLRIPESLSATDLLRALPQHSAPHAPAGPNNIYERLKTELLRPELPYSQGLDIGRTYLQTLGTSRFETLRTFQKEITEMPQGAALEPTGFQRDLWRLPVRRDMAIEYLCMSLEEAEIIFGGNMSSQKVLQILGIRGGRLPAAATICQVTFFLQVTGLSYCEFLELHRSGIVAFRPDTTSKADHEFPPCLPCCAEGVRMTWDCSAPFGQFIKMVIFARLWRALQGRCQGGIHMSTLADICKVLCLFNEGNVNPGFLVQLSSLVMLKEMWCLPWSHPGTSDPEATHVTQPPHRRTQLLSLWAGVAASEEERRWATEAILDAVEKYSISHYGCPKRPNSWRMVDRSFGDLSTLAGFDGTRYKWDSQPTCTIRFVEILSKLYASKFTVGEILFLFTNRPHLRGDDPYPNTEEDESLDDPLNVPEDEIKHGLWSLRRKLLDVCPPDDENACCWTWARIEATLGEMGFGEQWDCYGWSLGEHFFPEIMEEEGWAVLPNARRFEAQLPAGSTSAALWTRAGECSPFRIDMGGEEQPPTLWTRLPLRDHDVLGALRDLRQLNEDEQKAVQQLYLAPRSALTPFAFLFENFGHASEYMVQESCVHKRWRFFQRAFAAFMRRCHVIASHIHAAVVAAAHMDRDECVCEEGIAECESECPGAKVAWEILLRLTADGNRARTDWENDSGFAPTEFDVPPQLTGGAFAALLALTGTGLLGEYTGSYGGASWAETRGGLAGWGFPSNYWNSPVITVLPRLNIVANSGQSVFASFKNGFALDQDTGDVLSGAEPFQVTWSGALLVEESGCYHFAMRCPEHSGDDNDTCHCEKSKQWSVTLQRGQKMWCVLEQGFDQDSSNSSPHNNRDTPARYSKSISLRRGAYDMTVKFRQLEPDFDDADDLRRFHTGLDLKYSGPDTGNCLVTVPQTNLYLKERSGRLGEDDSKEQGCYESTIYDRYLTSLRDARRTFQRAFKAVLFAHRFCLSACRTSCEWESELGYLLSHAHKFSGVTYYLDDQGDFSIHRADLNFDLLPVSDAYFPPDAGVDQRVSPSEKRSAALFDWFERIFDYARLRRWVREVGEPPVWRLFSLVDEDSRQPVEQLVRFLDIDLALASLALEFFEPPNGVWRLSDEDNMSALADERWTTRVWLAGRYLERLKKSFYAPVSELARCRPALWAASPDGNAVVDGTTGNANLTRFVQRSALSQTDAPPRLHLIITLNDGLRLRARAALLALLAAHDHPTTNLNDRLLMDVEAGLSETTTRTDDAIATVQRFMQRVILGLEGATFVPSKSLLRRWECELSSFEKWQAAQRRKWYYENWVHWEEATKLSESEGFRSLKKSLRADVSTLSGPMRGQYLPQPTLPDVPGKRRISGVQSFALSSQYNARDEGLRLVGTPDHSASPTWLTTAPELAQKLPDPSFRGDDDEPQNPDLAKLTRLTDSSNGAESALGILLPGAEALDHIPLWIQAAVRLGTRFIRVAASGAPIAAWYTSNTTAGKAGPCCVCNGDHAPVMDEYYFWLEDARHYDPADAPAPQNADLHENVPGVVAASGQGNNSIDPRTREADPTSDWDAPTRPMLAWKSQPLVHLRWTKVHMGLLLDPRRSTEGIPLAGDNQLATLFLDLTGRVFDSLHFSLFAGDTTKGFRYDMATDSAVVIPEAIASTGPPALPFPAPLQAALAAFPYFLYFKPGAPLMPVDTFSTALVVAASLRADCKFEEASRWLRLTFDPLGMDNSWSQCEQQAAVMVHHKPGLTVEEAEDPPLSHDDTNLFAISLANETDEAVTAPRAGYCAPDVPCCPSAPVKPARARGRAATLEYLDTLLEWADVLRCRNSLQASQRALTLLTVIERVLGPKPDRITARDNTGGSMTVGAFEAYAAPLNPRLMELYYRTGDALESLRASLNKWHLGNGELGRDLAHFGTHTRFDAEGTRHDGPTDCGSSCCFSCCHPYRFTTVLPKALQWASLAKATAGALQMAIEKADGEVLSSLRLAQERQMTELGLEVSKNAYRAADWDVQALDKQMVHATTRLQYFQRLIERGLNTGEIAHAAATAASMGSRTSATVVDGIGQGMASVPDMWVGVAGIAGSPLQFNQMPMGVKLGTGFATAARILNTVADISGTSAGLSLTQAGWERREDEWQHSCDLTVLEIQQIKRQRLASRRRLDTALRDLDSTQRRIEHSAEVHDFARDKVSRYELYLYLQQENAALYRQLFDLALGTAREAQQALRFELGDTAISCLPASLASWDSLHEGLLAGEQLELALCAMERAHMSKHCREYELTKHISLRLHFPAAFVLLKATGYCEVDLPEWLFDLDYPGHYMRRIKAVSLTVPCVAGPYTGVHCKLQQLSSAIRFRPARVHRDTCKCCSKKKAAKAETARGSNNNKPPPPPPCPNDPHLWHRHAGTEAIATSTGQADSGLFELAFADQRYLPFEYSGAVSRWRIELPPENNQFDFDSLSDLVLHINYTAREGGDEFARESSAAAQRFLPGGGWRFFDVRHELPEVWNVVRKEPACERCAWKEDHSGDECECEDRGTCRWHGREKHDDSCEEAEEAEEDGGTGACGDKCKCKRKHGADGRRCGRESRHKKTGKKQKKKERRPAHATREFRLALTRDRFPFLTGRRGVTVTSVHLLVDVKGCGLRTAKVRFTPPPTSYTGRGKDCVDTEDIPLVPADGGMLKGSLALKTPVRLDDHGCGGLMGKEDGFVGTFSLPCELRGVRGAWLLCGYCAEERENCEKVAVGCCKEVR